MVAPGDDASLFTFALTNKPGFTLQNSEFHRTVEELTTWLDATTAAIRSTEPVDLSAEADLLRGKRDKFVRLRADLQRCEPRVVSLQEAADQLELQTDDEDRCRAVKAKLSLLSQKLRLLMNVCEVYSRRLDRALRGDGHAEEDEEGGDASPVLPRLSNEVSVFVFFLSIVVSFARDQERID
jgi:uncharacterized membrane protein YccC